MDDSIRRIGHSEPYRNLLPYGDHANPVEIEVDVLAVDTWVRRTERGSSSDLKADGDRSTSPRNDQSSTPADSTAVESMMAHLKDAKERQRERIEEERCENCRTINCENALTIETDVATRDLHHCANCNRLLLTSEYEEWKRVHEWCYPSTCVGAASDAGG